MRKNQPLFLFLLACNICFATSPDSLKQEKAVKRYIRPCIFGNMYATPSTDIEKKRINGQYRFSQASAGFYMPVYTSTWLKKDGITLSNFHLLMTGNVLSARIISDLNQVEQKRNIYKFAFGVRGIYNTGRKNTWFLSISPFAANDEYTVNKPSGKLALVFLFNRTVSRKFSYRIGFLRTFVFGEKYGLPIIGFRIGALDKSYLSIQLPKNISYNFPMGKHFSGSVFIRPIGGVYNFRVKTPGNPPTQLLFGRYEFLTGFLTNYRVNNDVSMFLSIGTSTLRQLSFNQQRFKINPSLFINFGLSVKLGRAKRSYNDINMYDVFDLNNSFDAMNNNDAPIDNGLQNNVSQRYQYKDIQDLITEEELY